MKPDILPDDPPYIWDFKTTGLAATPQHWGRTQLPEYLMQYGLYTRGIRKVLGWKECEMRFVVQETDPPYALAVFALADDYREFADRLADKAIRLWTECMKWTRWPSYQTDYVIEMDAPAWLLERATYLDVNPPVGDDPLELPDVGCTGGGAMSWTLVPASKISRKSSLVVGLSGLSGSGKTFSALLLAKTLACGGKVVGICTENNRMADYQDTSLYPGLNPYEMFEDGFEPPYSSARYTEAIMAAETAGAAVIVLDSGSDEWEGPGGVLDLHEQTLQRLIRGDDAKRDKMNFPAWAVAKPPHKKFANEIMRLKAHLIICFRASLRVRCRS